MHESQLFEFSILGLIHLICLGSCGFSGYSLLHVPKIALAIFVTVLRARFKNNNILLFFSKISYWIWKALDHHL